LDDTYEDLAVAVLANAMRHHAASGVLELLADALASAVEGHDWQRWERASREAGPEWLADTARRRRLLSLLLDRLTSKDSRTVRGLRLWVPDLACPDGFEWCLKRARSEEDAGAARFWATWANQAWDRENPDHWILAYDAHAEGGVLAEELDGFSYSVDTAQLGQHPEQGASAPADPQDDLDERVGAALSAARLVLKGHLGGWPSAARLCAEHDIGFFELLEQGLDTSDAWARMDETGRAEVVTAASHFLDGSDPEFSHWMEQGKYAQWWYYGYAALVLLERVAPARVPAESGTLWERWAPIILFCQTSVSGEEHHEQLLKKAQRLAPARLLEALRLMLNADKGNGSASVVASRLRPIWSPEVEEELLAAVQDETITPEAHRDMLNALIEHGSTDGMDYADQLVGELATQEDPDEGKRVNAALALMAHAPDRAWTSVWSMIRESGSSRTVVDSYDSPHHPRAWPALVEHASFDQVGELVRWLVRTFGDEAKRHFSGPSRVLQAVLKRLQEAGDPIAILLLDDLHHELPGWGFDYTAQTARAALRSDPERRPDPADVLRLCDSAHTRIVHTDADLQSLLVETFKNWEHREPGVTFHPVATLWNDRPRTPHQEETCRDRLVTWLQRKLCQPDPIVGGAVDIVAEDQLDSSPAKGKARAVDAGVRAVCRSDRGEVYDSRVPIEIKGPWHEDLAGEAPVRAGLVQRYLRKPGRVHGIYLVPWFLCAEWDGSDCRRADAVKHCGEDIDALRTSLQKEADALRAEGWNVEITVLDARWQ
jgi:hypothetical protein